MKESHVLYQAGGITAKVHVTQGAYKETTTVEVTTQYDYARDPNDERRIFKQDFNTQADYDKFVGFLRRFTSAEKVENKESPRTISVLVAAPGK